MVWLLDEVIFYETDKVVRWLVVREIDSVGVLHWWWLMQVDVTYPVMKIDNVPYVLEVYV